MKKELSISERFAPLRICADICFYFLMLKALPMVYLLHSDAAVLDLFKAWSSTMYIFAAAALAVGFVAVRCGSTPLRFALSLIPGICFIPCKHSFMLLFILVGWLYYIVVITVGAFEVSLMKYRRRARLMMLAGIFFSLLSLAMFVFQQQALPASQRSFFGFLGAEDVCGIVFFFLCVLSMRGMRAGDGAPIALFLADSAFIMAVVTAVYGLLALLFFVVLPFLVGGKDYFLRLFLRLVAWMSDKSSELSRIVYAIPSPTPYEGIEIPDLLPVKEVSPELDSFESSLSFQPLDLSISAYTVFGLILVIAVALCIYFALKNKPAKASVSAAAGFERTTADKPARKKKAARREHIVDYSRAARLRKIYKDYLKYLSSHRYYRLSASSSSQDVLDGTAAQIEAAENARLRELYIAARYGDPDAVTAEQLREAGECFDVISGK